LSGFSFQFGAAREFQRLDAEIIAGIANLLPRKPSRSEECSSRVLVVGAAFFARVCVDAAARATRRAMFTCQRESNLFTGSTQGTTGECYNHTGGSGLNARVLMRAASTLCLLSEAFALFAFSLLPAIITATEAVFASHYVTLSALLGAVSRSHFLLLACCVLENCAEWRKAFVALVSVVDGGLAILPDATGGSRAFAVVFVVESSSQDCAGSCVQA
jgi:hypothetical protein